MGELGQTIDRCISKLGCINVKGQTHEQEAHLPLLVVKGDGPSLLGHNWLTSLHLNWQEIFSVHTKQSLKSLLKQYEGVFKDKLGTLKGVKAKLHIDPEVKPLFYKAGTVHLLSGRRSNRNWRDWRSRISSLVSNFQIELHQLCLLRNMTAA